MTTAVATAIVSNGQVTAVTVTDGGSGYSAVPTVTFIGGGGAGALATATITGGAVTAIHVVTGGRGYTSAPTVGISLDQGPALLEYAILTTPDPVSIKQTLQLTLSVSNPGSKPVDCASITVLLPGPSESAQELTNSFTDIGVQVPQGNNNNPLWTSSQNGGAFTLTPLTKAAGQIGANGIDFIFDNILVNDSVGVCSIAITENSSSTSQPAGYHIVPPKKISKWPAQFSISTPTANPLEVAYGGATEVSWAVNGAGVTTKLIYDKDGRGDVTYSVANIGSTRVENITNPRGIIILTVQASMVPPGQSSPMIFQRQTTVEVTKPKPTIKSFTAAWDRPKLKIDWETEHADRVEISDFDAEQKLNGSTHFQPSPQQPPPPSFTLTATNTSGSAIKTLVQQGYEQAPGSPVPVGIQPVSVAVSPDGARVFVANSAGYSLTVLDAQSLRPVTGSPVPVGKYPISVAVSPDGARVFVANNNDRTLTVLDAQSLRPVTGSPVPVGESPTCVAVSPDGTRVFVVNSDDNTLTVLDAQLNQVTGSPVRVGNRAQSVAVSPDGARVFVVNSGDNTLTVLDAQLSPVPGSPVRVGNSPSSVAVSPDGGRVFVAHDTAYSLSVLGAQSLLPAPGSPVPAGTKPSSVAVSPDGARVFVVNSGDNNLMVFRPGPYAAEQ